MKTNMDPQSLFEILQIMGLSEGPEAGPRRYEDVSWSPELRRLVLNPIPYRKLLSAVLSGDPLWTMTLDAESESLMRHLLLQAFCQLMHEAESPY